jgi:hypothetical protein
MEMEAVAAMYRRHQDEVEAAALIAQLDRISAAAAAQRESAEFAAQPSAEASRPSTHIAAELERPLPIGSDVW